MQVARVQKTFREGSELILSAIKVTFTPSLSSMSIYVGSVSKKHKFLVFFLFFLIDFDALLLINTN